MPSNAPSTDDQSLHVRELAHLQERLVLVVAQPHAGLAVVVAGLALPLVALGGCGRDRVELERGPAPVVHALPERRERRAKVLGRARIGAELAPGELELQPLRDEIGLRLRERGPAVHALLHHGADAGRGDQPREAFDRGVGSLATRAEEDGSAALAGLVTLLAGVIDGGEHLVDEEDLGLGARGAARAVRLVVSSASPRRARAGDEREQEESTPHLRAGH